MSIVKHFGIRIKVDIVVEAPRVVLGTQKHTNITTMIKAMMEVVGGFCERPEEATSQLLLGGGSERAEPRRTSTLRSFTVQVPRKPGER